MRYINKEYGFSFRPPFLDNFSEETPKGPAVKDTHFPGEYIIGAGYDYSAINGAMLIGPFGSIWGVKVTYFDGKKWLSGDDFIGAVGANCANTADGSFARFESGPLTLKWAREGGQGLAFSASTSAKKLRIRVIFYPCFGWPGEMSAEGASVKGRSPYVAAIPGDIALNGGRSVFRSRYRAVIDDKPEREFFTALSYDKPAEVSSLGGEVIMEFFLDKVRPGVCLYAAIGNESLLSAEIPTRAQASKLLEAAEVSYSANRVIGKGLGHGAEKMFNSVLFSRLYYPYLLDVIYSPSRAVLDEHFNLDGTAENAAAILAGVAIDGKTAENQLETMLEDKLLSAFAIWQIYCRIKEKARIVKLFNKLIKLYPPDARLVISAGAEKAEIAYKQPDSPLKEKHNPQPMYSLDLSCARLLIYDILERIAVKFDLSEALSYGRARKELARLINESFWNEEEKLYVGRYVNKEWVQTYGATSFWPLISGAVNSPERLASVAESLTNPKLFWGEYAVPTLSRNDREFGKKTRTSPPCLDYRGSILPYMNYLIYHGLVRYGLDEIAGEFAAKCVRLWGNEGSYDVENYSHYLPNGQTPDGKEYISASGSLLALIGVQELIDLEYFRPDLSSALRFGTFCKGSHSLNNLKIMGRAMSIESDDKQTVLTIDRVVFSASGGRCRVRQYHESRDGNCSFLIDAGANLQVTLHLPLFAAPGEKRRRVGFAVPAGKSKVVVEGDVANIAVM